MRKEFLDYVEEMIEAMEDAKSSSFLMPGWATSLTVAT
jgi:hypothetical protein